MQSTLKDKELAGKKTTHDLMKSTKKHQEKKKSEPDSTEYAKETEIKTQHEEL